MAWAWQGCEQAPRESRGYFDSLVSANASLLLSRNASVFKETRVGAKRDVRNFVPDSASWQRELEIFRQLDIFDKPAYRGAYEVVRGQKDTRSNLQITEYRAVRSAPVRLLRFYYLDTPGQLKKVEAAYHEANALYDTERRLSLSFEDFHGTPLLSKYTLTGRQQIVLSDSVTYSIEARVDATPKH